MDIICIGDSLTAGTKAQDPSLWINILNREARNTYVNKGIMGDTTGGMLARFQKDVVETGARCCIIMGGGNDFITGNSVGAIQANIMAMAHQAYYNRVIPIIGVPVPFVTGHIREDWADFTDYEEVEIKYARYRQWLCRFGKTFHTDVIDFAEAFEKAGGDLNNYYADGVHPNEKGNRIMADLLLNAGM